MTDEESGRLLNHLAVFLCHSPNHGERKLPLKHKDTKKEKQDYGFWSQPDFQFLPTSAATNTPMTVFPKWVFHA